MARHSAKQFFVICHNIRSLHNVGSVFRTADALGVSKVFLTGYTGTPPDSKIAKVALGAEQFVRWEYAQSPARLLKCLRLEFPQLVVVGLENNLKSGKLTPLNKFRPQFPLALIIGEETKGIPKPLLAQCDQLVEIPMRGQKESLNVSVAFGIAAYHLVSENS